MKILIRRESPSAGVMLLLCHDVCTLVSSLLWLGLFLPPSIFAYRIIQRKPLSTKSYLVDDACPQNALCAFLVWMAAWCCFSTPFSGESLCFHWWVFLLPDQHSRCTIGDLQSGEWWGNFKCLLWAKITLCMVQNKNRFPLLFSIKKIVG